jgi:hypothetical protein
MLAENFRACSGNPRCIYRALAASWQSPKATTVTRIYWRNYLALRGCFLLTPKKLRRGILISCQNTAIARQACDCSDKTQRIASQSASLTGKRCEYTIHKREI